MRFCTSRGISMFFHQTVEDRQYLKAPADKQERDISPLSSRVRYLRTTPFTFNLVVLSMSLSCLILMQRHTYFQFAVLGMLSENGRVSSTSCRHLHWTDFRWRLHALEALVRHRMLRRKGLTWG